MATHSGTYVYCIVKGEEKPSASRTPAGVPGGGLPRLIEAGARTWIVVSDVPLRRYGADTINRHLQDLDWVSQRALAHEAVVEFFARTHDVIPMKLFTIFHDDERARSHVGSAASVAGVFRRIAGCAEWSVRLSCSPSAVSRPPGTRQRSAKPSGTSFLRQKKTQRDEARRAGVAARSAVEQVFQRLDAIARDSVRKRSDVPGSQVMLDAAFLVSRRRQAAFEREVARLAARTAPTGCEIVLSGPWPAYHFVGDR